MQRNLLLITLLNVSVLQADVQLAQLQASLDAQLSSLGPSARQQYADLISEQAALLNEQQRYEEDLGDLDRELATAEGEMARNPFKQKALDLQVGPLLFKSEQCLANSCSILLLLFTSGGVQK
jgi:hypothetical protein